MTLDGFLPRVEPEPMSGCWLWTGSIGSHGYGDLRTGGVHYLAHRLSWELHHGHIPPGLSVLHRCDNQRCVNPGHLFIGTHADNMRDMWSKGRGHRLGHPHPWRYLTACKHGHPLSGDNLRVERDGARVCRICAQRRRDLYRARRTAS